MKSWKPTALALAVAATLPFGTGALAAPAKKPAKPASAAVSTEALLQELQALKARVAELEGKAATAQAKAAAPAPAVAEAAPSGMTADQQGEFNRIAVKTEALEDAMDEQGMKNLKITGFIDPTYIYNKAQNTASFQLLNRDDGYYYDNGYFGMAVLDFQKEMEGGTRFKLTLAPNRGAGEVFNESILHEASVNIPLTDLQTRLWVGQIPDWTGYEMTQSPLNKLVTHNLLFDTMAPTAYTGAVLDLTEGKWWTRVGLANVNASRITAAANGSGNKTPALIYRVDYAKGEFGGFGFSGVHGKLYNYAADDVDGNGDFVFADNAGKYSMTHLLEADAYFIRGDLTLQGQVSWGKQAKAAIFREDGELRDAQWWGLSGLAAYKLTPRFEVVARADYIDNTKNGGGLLGYTSDDGRNGIGRGMVYDDVVGAWGVADPSVGTKRYAVSLGMNYLFNQNTIFKAEYRLDGANGNVFNQVNDGSYSKRNHLFGASAVVSF